MKKDIIGWWVFGHCSDVTIIFDWSRLPLDKFVEKWDKWLPQAQKIVPASYDGDLREGVL